MSNSTNIFSKWVIDRLTKTLLKWTTNTIFSSDYKSIAEIVSKTGSTQITLILHSSIPASNIAEVVTIPSNISISPENPGVITKSSATSLTINGPVVGNPMHQWLSGFAAGEVLFPTGTEVFANWWGTNALAVDCAI